MSDEEVSFVDEDEISVDQADVASFAQAVTYSSDWTVETILSQLDRGNIDLNPRFQRRDAWSAANKSRFVESILLGLPIPQLVLAEKREARGQYIVLDGKQRLLTLLQFSGKAEGAKNKFGLTSLEVLQKLSRKKYSHFVKDPELANELNALLNHTIRTVVIRNWPSTNFLNIVFLRLNTGSVKLSPQELRQAVVPGPFTDFADDAAAASAPLQNLLSRKTPDPRMRDVELLVRFFAFRRFLKVYRGRMKDFLDMTCDELNKSWDKSEQSIRSDVEVFNTAVNALLEIFGPDKLARKPDSRSFNRAIFDALVYFAANEGVGLKMQSHAAAVRAAYDQIWTNEAFNEAVESDTAGIPHTVDRLRIWGASLAGAIGELIALPEAQGNQISVPLSG